MHITPLDGEPSDLPALSRNFFCTTAPAPVAIAWLNRASGCLRVTVTCMEPVARTDLTVLK